MEDPTLDRLKRKYWWWLSTHQEEGPMASSEKAGIDDSVSLFEGRNTWV
jgi:hypothetical protein